MALAVTDQTFNEEVLNFQGIALVDFWAEWCSPCKAIAPIIEKLGEENVSNEKVKILKLDVDVNPVIQGKYQVFSIPTLILFKNGEVVKTMVGLHPEEEIRKEIQTLLESA